MKFLKDSEWQELMDRVSKAENATSQLSAISAERDEFKTRAESAEQKATSLEAAHKSEMEAAQKKMSEMEAEHSKAIEALKATHAAAIEKLAGDHKAAMEAKDKSVDTLASHKAADIAKTAGLDAPIAESAGAATATDIAGLREQLAKETDPTKKANIAREIRRLTDAAKAKK